MNRFRYVIKCTHCKRQVEGHVRVHFVFHKALPYCWDCREQLKDNWIEETIRERDNQCGFGNGAWT